MRGIRTIAEQHRPSEDMREDIARLADSIHHLDQVRAPGAEGLRAEFEDLRSLMDGLAREDSVRQMESRWEQIEERLEDIDPAALREELVRLAERLDDIKAHLGTMGDNRAIHALEDKLVTLAAALEHIGAHIDPSERMMQEQFAGIDMRLDEITRAIAAGSRLVANGPDNSTFQRIEDRIGGLARQIELLAHNPHPETASSGDLGDRIEALAARIEELTAEQAASRLEERLDHLSQLLERTQKPLPQPELTSYLADISRKIDALDHGEINDRLADRLDMLARRIEEIDVSEPAPARIDDSVLRHFEERLNAVVDRLEETNVAPAGDNASLRGLEEQIAHLSALISNPSAGPDADNPFAGRVSALEDYMATSDEYIIEAARQAAETVMESYARRAPVHGSGTAEVAALSELSDHLRHLQDFSRNSEERTQRTFEALHDTLVQIATRLDQMGEGSEHNAPAPAMHEALSSEPVPPVATAARQTAPEVALPAVAPHKVNGHALSHDQADTLTTDAAIDEGFRADRKAEKPRLLAGLGRRLLPGPKKEEQSASGRRHIDEAPSIDPTEVLPPDEANELLEPGSGAPDVRKILERVRASQANQGANAGSGDNDDRADYIAAARRAAQAAAMEMEYTPRTVATAQENAQEKASRITRYRRPIMMAVGAILLAAMAMPLVNTLTRGENSPAALEAPQPDESSMAPTAGGAETAAQSTAAPSLVDVSVLTAGPAATEPTIMADATAQASTTLIDRTPLGESDPQTLKPAGDVQVDGFAAARSASSAVAATDAAPDAEVAAQPATTVAAEIIVPAEITPPSLVLAAKQGDPLALFEIGARYTDGRGVPGDFAEAAKWYRLAADRGFAPAQYRLANLLEKGAGVPRDIVTAKALYQQAADAGNASAMHNLAVLHASGSDGVQDYTKAAEWFGKAAEHGISDSQFNLAILYARGNGVPQDLNASYKWFALVAKEGDKDAAQKRDEVANAMKPEQLEQARAEVDLWKAKGPIVRFQTWLTENGIVHDNDISEIEEAVAAEINEAVAFAEAGTWEPVETLTRDVYASVRPVAPPKIEPSGETVEISYRDAIKAAIVDALERDARTFLMGEDVGQYGGCYAVSKGLYDRFGPQRIRDTPLSESGFTGAGIGAAVAGMRPIVEVMTVNFSLLALDQILNTAATFRHMSNGQFGVPVVIRMATGAGRQLAAQHSHSLEGWYAHIPGIRVLTPATLEDARGMLWTALEDPDPVLIFENVMLYNRTGQLATNAGPVDIDRAAIRREGRDVSLITYGGSLFKTLDAAEQLSGDGIDAEVIDLRTLRPLDMETVLASLAKTHRAVIVDEGWRSGSLAAEIGMQLAERGFFDLDAPLVRVCSEEVPIPYPAHLEQASIPQVGKIVAAVKAMFGKA